MTGSAGAFRIGQRVRVRTGAPPHHTRMPGYLRGHTGRVRVIQPPAPLPDDIALNAAPVRQLRVYTIAFTSHALWRQPGAPAHEVLCDLWECYLEPAWEPLKASWPSRSDGAASHDEKKERT
ncbi:SH3-like domain-containing protein [Streptomyces sp. NPDC088400]|uniref:SH3-like domain-containing protein n=1 Tax=Streptomyces sp. NPDC088400 TaxID=3365861 RepID=UPI0038196057